MFKVGDHVTIISRNETGVIINIKGRLKPFEIETDDTFRFCEESDIELITPTPDIDKILIDYRAKYEALVKACEPLKDALAQYESIWQVSSNGIETNNSTMVKITDLRAITQAIGGDDARA